ncbi:MAG TPA: hypothetical protein VIV40_23305 [Kofleriaceae bacterium]
MTALLHIEHPVQDFESWRRAFDADPVDRRGSGVRRYRYMRAVDDPSYVVIDLELETREQAERLLGKLNELWARIAAKALKGPVQTRIYELAGGEELPQ